MSHSYGSTDPRRPLLGRHLDKLQEAMQGLSEQTRDALARILAGLVAGLVCEAVRCALSAPEPHPYSHSPAQHERRPRSLMDTLDDLDPELMEDAPEPWDDSFAGRTIPDRPSHAPPPAGGSAELALGLRVAAWWLGQGKGQRPLLAALALGTAATMASALGGPVVATSFGLFESVLAVIRLGAAVSSARQQTGFSRAW